MNSIEGIIRETTIGIQEYQLLEPIQELNSLVRHNATWAIPITGNDMERGLVRWLEEVLYRGYGEGQWLVDLSISTSNDFFFDDFFAMRSIVEDGTEEVA